MSYIKVFDFDTPEHKALDFVAATLNKFTKYNICYEVRDIYFDYGQKWMWTTLVVHTNGHWGGYQISPKEQEAIITCDSFEKFTDIINYYLDKEPEEAAT